MTEEKWSTKITRILRHHWLTVAFVGGFVTDFLLLNRVDDVFDNTILSLYVLLATASLLSFYASLAHRFGDIWSPRINRLSSLLMQYAYGGLFSGMLIFYGKSGSWLSSWPFLLMIIGAILGNELIKNRGQKLLFNLLSYFIGLFSFVVLQVPVWTGYMGGWIFLASSLLALGGVLLVIRWLSRIIPNYLLLEKRKIMFVIFGTFALLQVLYFTNIIPPIPLSLKEITIAQSVVKMGNVYEVTYEPVPWWRLDQHFNEEFHPGANKSVACFTRVFAPTKLNTDIYHVWDYKDKTGHWQRHFRLAYPISGADDRGYRGYTAISNYHDGVWRCRVETARGQVLGEQVFTIDSTQTPTLVKKQVD